MATKARTYTVTSGDTLWGISQHFDTDVETLARLNHLQGRQKHILSIGQVIVLPDAQDDVDTELTIRVLDLAFRPIKRPKLKLEFDAGHKELVGSDQGLVGPVKVLDHAKGLKVWFKELDGRYALIAEHEALPLGRKQLTLTSRRMLVRGKYWVEQGSGARASADVKREIQRTHPTPHIPVQPSSGSPAPGAKAGSSAASKPAAAPAATAPKPQQPQPVVKETRVDGGKPQQAVGAVFAEGNLHLSPANEKYRKLLLDISKKHALTPHALAALINAEASKLESGEWNANAQAGSSSAAGLTQFLNRTWLQVATDKRSAVKQKLKADHGYEQVNGQWQGDTYSIYGKKGKVKTDIKSAPVLALRFTPAYSIDAAAVYGLINLDYLADKGLNIAALAPEDKAKVMYLAHHEGAAGALDVIKGALTEERAAELLPIQVGAKKAKELAGRFGGKYAQAYPYWLYAYTDSKINVVNFMVKPDGLQPRTMSDIAKALNGQAAVKPKPKAAPAPSTPAQKPASSPTPAASSPAPGTVGGIGKLVNPLAVCTIRTAGLASARSATFGKVRNNNTKNHQGIDLAADSGTTIYAVANGKVISLSRAFTATSNIGAYVLLAVDVNDLPEKQRKHYQASYPNNKEVYFFYAHLSEIDAALDKPNGKFVTAGKALGKTGASGNAKGMTTIAKGGHLHFEVRHRTNDIGKGLGGRIDPLPFLVSYTMPK